MLGHSFRDTGFQLGDHAEDVSLVEADVGRLSQQAADADAVSFEASSSLYERHFGTKTIFINGVNVAQLAR